MRVGEAGGETVGGRADVEVAGKVVPANGFRVDHLCGIGAVVSSLLIGDTALVVNAFTAGRSSNPAFRIFSPSSSKLATIGDRKSVV